LRIAAQPQTDIQIMHGQGTLQLGRILDGHACTLRQIGAHGMAVAQQGYKALRHLSL
jgi:hypothetical protein